MSENECPGCRRMKYRDREFSRVRDSARFWEEQAKRSAAEVERLKLDAEWSRYRDRTDVAWKDEVMQMLGVTITTALGGGQA